MSCRIQEDILFKSRPGIGDGDR